MSLPFAPQPGAPATADAPIGVSKRTTAPYWWPNMRDVLALLSTLIFAVGMIAPMIWPTAKLDPDLKGALILQWGLVMGWYFASSKSSAAKDATIAQLSKAKETGA